MKSKTLCFDIDGVICKTTNNNYKNSTPNKKVIKLINQLYEKNKIILFTSRFMGRNKDKVSLAKKQGYEFTKKQLKRWKIKYHVLKFGKPSYDLFIDDKNFDFRKNWYKKFKSKYQII